MKKNIVIAVLGLTVLTLGWLYFFPANGAKGSEELPVADDTIYTCPMHPTVKSDRPGACPVCGMALVKKSTGVSSSTMDTSQLQRITLSPTQRVVANITTVPVQHKPLVREVRSVGVVDVAEPNYLHISMRFPGRLEKLYLTHAGQTVRPGDPVAEVYSPEAISAQQEFLLALENNERLANAGERVRREAATLLDEAREKLVRWGFSGQQLKELGETRRLPGTVMIHSPIGGTVLKKNVDPQHYAETGEDIYDIADLSIVWVYLDVYENEIRFVKPGQKVQMNVEAYPGEVFTGVVSLIDPVVDASTRTIRVRTEFSNPSGRLKPNMYVEATITVSTSGALVVPASAVVSVGRSSVVWVEVDANVFEPRTVTTGSRTETYVEILDGLEKGEQVASTGGFLIDSESLLRAPGARGQAGDHNHETHQAAEGDGAGPQEVHIHVEGGYKPGLIRVKRGRPVRLNFYRNEESECTEEIIIEPLNIRRHLAPWKTTMIEFTPAVAGTIPMTCGMHMLEAMIVVEE